MIREEAIEVLRVIAQKGSATLRQLHEGHGEEMRGHIIHLHRKHEFLDTEKTRGDVVLYSVSEKGRRFLSGLDKPAGKVPEPRTGPPTEAWKPKPWKLARAGADAHEKCPSIRNGTAKPWEPPMLICPAKVEAVGNHKYGG